MVRGDKSPPPHHHCLKWNVDPNLVLTPSLYKVITRLWSMIDYVIQPGRGGRKILSVQAKERISPETKYLHFSKLCLYRTFSIPFLISQITIKNAHAVLLFNEKENPNSQTSGLTCSTINVSRWSHSRSSLPWIFILFHDKGGDDDGQIIISGFYNGYCSHTWECGRTCEGDRIAMRTGATRLNWSCGPPPVGIW